MFSIDIKENQRQTEDYSKRDNKVDIFFIYNCIIINLYYFKLGLIVSKNMPPVAGGISWARSIFYRIKRPIIKFLTKEDTLDKDLFQTIKKEYKDLAKMID